MNDDLWVAYHRERDLDTRNALVEAHLPLVKYIATRMLPGLHASVEHQDLVAWGCIGLIDAIERFDPDAGAKFSTFATYRIQGSITDEMRAQAWEPRSVRARFRAVQAAMTDLERELGRPPADQEVATRIGCTLEELARIHQDVDSSRVTALSTPVGGQDLGEGRAQLGDFIASSELGSTEHEMGELAASVGEAVSRLPEQDRVLLQWVYVQRMPFKEIAKVLGVTESWVSHLHTRGLVRLQRVLSAAY